MPRTKKQQPARHPQPQPPPRSLNGPFGEVLTLAEAAEYFRLPEAEVVGLVHSQGLPGRCIAGELASSRPPSSTGLPRRHLCGKRGSPPFWS